MDNPEKSDNIGTTRQRKEKNPTPHCAHTNNGNKTRAILQTTRGKEEPNIVFMRKS
jgi:hypothetical protein